MVFPGGWLATYLLIDSYRDRILFSPWNNAGAWTSLSPAAIRGICITYIEVIRGVPLVTILFMAQVMLPFFLSTGTPPDMVLRAVAGITLFSAAYLAENVRGGLQAIPQGQYEAAYAVGLSGFKTMIYIILPQALRTVIPVLVGQFISLFKDTTLVSIAHRPAVARFHRQRLAVEREADGCGGLRLAPILPAS